MVEWVLVMIFLAPMSNTRVDLEKVEGFTSVAACEESGRVIKNLYEQNRSTNSRMIFACIRR